METSLRKKTLGALLRAFEKYVEIGDQGVKGIMSKGLGQRNFLIHNYFLTRQKEFATRRGRLGLIAELVQIMSVLEEARKLIGGMRVALHRALENPSQLKSGKPLFSIKVQMNDDFVSP